MDTELIATAAAGVFFSLAMVLFLDAILSDYTLLRRFLDNVAEWRAERKAQKEEG